ncbi:MAG TPA: DUF2155 domain-containing protein [Caulobacteraceae bacterium]|nr:DUF2155 domain-containing protein [Caulobacteraceae bacterium]
MRSVCLGAALTALVVLTGAPVLAQTPATGGDEASQLLEGSVPAAHNYARPPQTTPAPAKPAAAAPAQDAADDSASDAPPPKVVAPAKRPRRNAAILQALDKVTAETLRFEAQVNQPVRYKDLVFTVHACEDSASDETQPGSYAHIEIDSQPKAPPGQAPPPARQLFRGWMFANAPGVNPFQHPVYDAWLIACKTAAPGS